MAVTQQNTAAKDEELNGMDVKHRMWQNEYNL